MVAGLRFVGLVVLGVALVIGGSAGAIYAISDMQLKQQVDAPLERLTVPNDIASVQYGQHLAGAIAMCTDCHGSNLAGKVLSDNQTARIVAPNLTRGGGGVGASLSDAEIGRAIRQGIDPTGRLLLVMPSNDYARMSDADLGAMLAFIRSVPPIGNQLPPSEVRTLGRVLIATGQLAFTPSSGIDRRAARPQAPGPGLTSQYGEYLTEIAGCQRCHAAVVPGGDWSEAEFLRAIRTGRRPDGSVMNSAMPWPYFAQMSELELRAIYLDLQSAH